MLWVQFPREFLFGVFHTSDKTDEFKNGNLKYIEPVSVWDKDYRAAGLKMESEFPKRKNWKIR